MTERAESDAADPGPVPETGDMGTDGAVQGAEGTPKTDEELASADLAALYVQQGEYERGIAMYRRLLVAAPGSSDLKERLGDAEALADLLILRPPKAQFHAGYREGYQQGLARRGSLTDDERVARLTAWLERVKDRA